MSTNFLQGLLVDGVPVGLPPITGTYYHVCPGSSTLVNQQGVQVVGSSGNSGLDPLHPLDSVLTAYNKCVSGVGDGIVVWGFGTSTAMNTTYLTSLLTWSKSNITMVGLQSPPATSQRARISTGPTSILSPVITMSGSDNRWYNIDLYNGGYDNTCLQNLRISGSRNYFFGCHISTPGSTTAAQTAGAMAVNIYGGRENYFERCTFGMDSVDQGGNALANGTVVFTGSSGGAAQDPTFTTFKDCVFKSYYSYANANSGAIKFAGSGDAITRHVMFDNCIFTNYKTGTITTTPPATLVIGTAPNNGVLIFHKCCVVGFAAMAGAITRVYSDNATPVAAGTIAVVDPS